MAGKRKIEAPDEFYTDLSVGEILRRARMQAGQTIEDAERALRIRAQYLEALEKSEFHRLPGRVYAIGFVRTYAEYLGLDGGRTVMLLKRQVRGLATPQALNFPAPVSESHLPPLPVVAGSLGVLLLVSILWGLAQESRLGRSDRVPEVPAGTVPAAMTPEGMEAETRRQAALVQAEEEKKVTQQPSLTVEEAPVEIRVTQDSWMELRNPLGRVVEARLFRAGEVVPISAPVDPVSGQPWRLTAGNAGGVYLRIDGKDQPPLGEPGKVRRNVELGTTVPRKTP